MNYFFQIGHISGELFVDEICKFQVTDVCRLLRTIDLTKLIQNEVLPKYMRSELEQNDEPWFREFDTELIGITYANGYFSLLVNWMYRDDNFTETFDLRFQPITETRCLATYRITQDQNS